MNFPAEELAELNQFCGEVKEYEEGGVAYLLLKGLQLPSGCVPETADVLFCPSPLHGYNARLFFPVQVQSSKTLNWNMQTRILERNWHAFSWQLQPSPLRLAQKVAIILGALR